MYDVHLGLIRKRVVDFLLLVTIELFLLDVTKIGDFATTRSVWPKILDRRGHPPPSPIIFAWTVRPMNALQLCRWQFSHTKNFVADLLQAKCDFRGKTAVLRFWAPFGDIGATYDDHRRLIRKRVADFLLVLIKFISLGVTAEALRAIICAKSAISLQRGSVNPQIQFQVEEVAPSNHFFSQKTRINDLSDVIKIWTDFCFFLSQSTRLTDRETDGRTDGQTDRQNSHHLTASAFHAAR